MFKLVKRELDFQIYVETLTEVLYVCTAEDFSKTPTTISIMFDADGKPLTLDKYNKLNKDKYNKLNK